MKAVIKSEKTDNAADWNIIKDALKGIWFLNVSISSKNVKPKIEIQYSENTIHDNYTMKTNLFFLFTTPIIFNQKISLFNIFDVFTQLTTDIITALDRMGAIYERMNQSNIKAEYDYIIWAFYDIFSTIYTFFLSLFNGFEYNESSINSNEENNIPEQIKNIKKKYRILKDELKNPYQEKLQKLENEEVCELSNILGIDYTQHTEQSPNISNEEDSVKNIRLMICMLFYKMVILKWQLNLKL